MITFFYFKDVIKVSKLYLPGMAKGFDNEKVHLYIGDGFEFLNNHKNEFDVIITDSSDPEGDLNLNKQTDYMHTTNLFFY